MSFGAALEGARFTASSDVIFVAIEFESLPGRKCDLNEFGLAKLEASIVLSYEHLEMWRLRP